MSNASSYKQKLVKTQPGYTQSCASAQSRARGLCLLLVLMLGFMFTVCQAWAASDSKKDAVNKKSSKSSKLPKDNNLSSLSKKDHDKVRKFQKWLNEHPKKIFVAAPNNKNLASFFAENSVTLTPKLGVMGVDFRNGAPKRVWIYAKKVYPAKCTYVFLKDSDIRAIAINLAQEGKNEKEKIALERLYRHIHIKMECVTKEPVSNGLVKSLIIPAGKGFPAIVTKRGAFKSGFFSSIYRTGIVVYILQL